MYQRISRSIQAAILSPWRSTIGHRFWRTDRGVSALEFAMLAPFIFALILSCIELGILYTRISFLEYSMSSVTRSIYTHSMNIGDISTEQLIEDMCSTLGNVMDCGGENASVTISVLETNEDSFDSSAEDSFGGALVFAEFTVLASPVVPGLSKIAFAGVNLGLNIPTTDDGKIELTTSTVFRIEPS